MRIPPAGAAAPDKPWAVRGDAATRRNLITSIFLEHHLQEKLITKLEDKYREMQDAEVRWDEFRTEDLEILVVAYGISSRIARAAVELAREDGVRAALLRPISLYPFPSKRIRQLAGRAYAILVFELSSGKMVEDVRLAVNGITPVELLRRTGGMMPTPEEIVSVLKTMESESVGNKA